MANPNFDDIVTTTLENRMKELRDNMTKNSALLDRLKKNDNVRTVDGGTKIIEELEYGEGDLKWYSGYDTINYTPKQLFTAAEYALKLCAVPVAISGEEQLINSGKERAIDLFDRRIKNAMKTMVNQLAAAVYGDGTGSGGKAIGGLKLLIADDPTSGTVGGINRATTGNEFWRNQSASDTITSANIKKKMHDLYLKCTRNLDKPDLIVADDAMYTLYNDSLVELQRFTSPEVGEAGYKSLKFKGADVVCDGGQGGACPENHMYFLNTKYIYLRPHKDRNMKVIGGNRMAINQDAIYKLIGWAGNMTMSNASLQGVLINQATS